MKNMYIVGRKVEVEVERLDVFDNCISDALDKHTAGKNNQRGDASKVFRTSNFVLLVLFKKQDISRFSNH